jgi:Ca2+-binding EF-hand superfamily protein
MSRILYTSIFALLAAGPAAAQSNGSEASFCQDGYVHADADDDGLISNEELQTAISQEFDDLDRDASGDITIEEIEDCLNADAGTRSAGSDRVIENLAEADTDGDEMLTPQEFMDAAEMIHTDVANEEMVQPNDPRLTELRRYIFIAVDGSDRSPADMTGDEIAARAAMQFRNLDTDTDEQISPAEWAQESVQQRDLSSSLNIAHTEMDADRSGTVSREEYMQARMEDAEAARQRAEHAGEISAEGNGPADVPVVYYRYESVM